VTLDEVSSLAAQAAELVANGNAAYVDEEYATAAAAYSAALQMIQGQGLQGLRGLHKELAADVYAARAQAHIQLEDFVNAVDDANRALEANPQLHKAYLRKGVACFWLEEYETAKAAFLTGMALADSPGHYDAWIRKCEAEMQEEDEEGKAHAAAAPLPAAAMAPAPASSAPAKAPTSAPPAPTAASAPRPAEEVAPAKPADTASPSFAAQAAAAEAPAPPAPNSKYRHQWYQSPTKVTLSIMAKGIKSERAEIHIDRDAVSVHIKDPSLEALEYALDLQLCGVVDPTAAKVEFLSTKIEISLPKADGLGLWPGLEREAAAGIASTSAVVPVVAPAGGRPAYPSSYAAGRKKAQDWDKLETLVKEEEKDEKLEGDAALQKLFRDIYGNSDEDTRRAMNKSFLESNGTVLSTNWKEIGTKTVECTPPAGMEVKKYDQ